MKRTMVILIFSIVGVITILLSYCGESQPVQREPNTITLTWSKSYETQTQSDIKTGMIWTLSWLGAELPKGSFEKACSWKDTTQFTINLDSVGFSEPACVALRVICDSIKRSEEYAHYGGIDVGKFVTLTLGSSWHYYAITGVPGTLAEFRTTYRIDASPYVYGVTTSGISEGHRRILFSRDTSLFAYGFLGEEGSGSLDSGSFIPEVYECFDLMPNGQLRFMIYDKNGELMAGTPEHIGDAGKPAKCLWCHETVIQPLFINNVPVEHMLSNEAFLLLRDSMQLRLERYRLTLNTDMNWKDQRAHTKAELLYITFLAPSLMHLMNEWNMSEADVKSLLGSMVPRKFEEFDYIGDVYGRASVDNSNRARLRTLTYPMDVRETGEEVNYFRD